MKLKENHPYYSQVQGQMAIGGRVWNDFIIYTNRGIRSTKTSGTAPSYLYLRHFMTTVWHHRYCIQSVFLYEIYTRTKRALSESPFSTLQTGTETKWNSWTMRKREVSERTLFPIHFQWPDAQFQILPAPRL